MRQMPTSFRARGAPLLQAAGGADLSRREGCSRVGGLPMCSFRFLSAYPHTATVMIITEGWPLVLLVTLSRGLTRFGGPTPQL